MFDKAKDLYKLKQRADLLKKKMAQVVVEVEVRGAKVTMRGDQTVDEVLLDGQVQADLRKALNKAVKKSQKEVAKKMRGDFSDFSLPGM